MSNAIIPGDDVPWELLKQTVNIHAKAGLIPSSTTFEQAMVCAALGHQLGIPRFEAMRGIIVVDGKPTLMAGLLSAVVTRSIPTLQVELVEYERDVCTVRGRRSPDDAWTQVTWDMEDAKLAGLTGKKNWQRYPKAMLYARASTTLLRMLGADVVHGLYTPDELGAMENPDEGMATVQIVQPGPTSSPSPAPASASQEPVETPFTPNVPAASPEFESEVDELAARINGGSRKDEPSEPSEKPSDEPKKENKTQRLTRLAKALKAEGVFKTQTGAMNVLKFALDGHPDASDEVLLKAAEAHPATQEEKPKEAPAKRERRAKPIDVLNDDKGKYEAMSADALMDACSDLEDKFTEGRDGPVLGAALDARKAAQDESPNWASTEKQEELAVYAINLATRLKTLDS